ncbi:GYD domain-containing protein [Bradyrhizobium liaoningense]|uniref:GYD domain-containing protein n=1 Tax=Bradyrhizobium liaoningense TaxID=43992 RepID=UPI001BADF275|nr:GYD domain-containing protein [Bradyrhizobium liaoningense]MBR0820538.1 GYD domain-containing protein [Bradyrhizobium liaoningense]
MPLFISYVSYSNSGIKGLVDKPADRTAIIGAMIEKAGGKLQGAFMTTGAHDALIVAEFPDGADAVAIGMAAAASGAIAKIETVRAWKMGDFKAIAEKAAKLASVYVPPGK